MPSFTAVENILVDSGVYTPGFQVTGDQRYSSIAPLSGGGYVVVYSSNLTVGIKAQIYDAAGSAVGGIFLVNTSNGQPTHLDVTALSGGGFVVTWQNDASGTAGTAGIRAQLFTAAGVASGAELSVSPDADASQITPEVAALGGGGFAVTWLDGSGGDAGVHTQIFDSSGAKVGTPSTLTGSVATTDFDTTALSGGGFAAVWTDTSNGSATYVQRYDNTGVAVGSPIYTGAGPDPHASIGGLDNGGFVVTYLGGPFNLFSGTVYDATGHATGSVRLDPSSNGAEDRAAISALPDGRFVITWTAVISTEFPHGPHMSEALAQMFDADGEAAGQSFRVGPSETPYTYDIEPAVTALAGGGLAFSWTKTTMSVPYNVGYDVYSMVLALHTDVVVNSELTGTAARDWLIGGTGDDIINGGAGRDIIDGGAGIDMATYAGATDGVTVFMGSNIYNTGDAAGDSFAHVEGLIGTAYADILGGDANDNRLEGGDGNDWLVGGVGFDVLMGGNGNDVLDGGANADLMDGGAGADVVSYRNAMSGVVFDLTNTAHNTGDAAGDEIVRVENIWGTNYADTIISNLASGGQIYGFDGADSLTGGSGNDVFYGGQGADTLTTGAGSDDIFYLSWRDHMNASGTTEPFEGGDTITDFTHGVDHITVSRYWFGFGNIAGPAAALTAGDADFITSGGAVSSMPTFFWNAAMGLLEFDPDGTGLTSKVVLATLQGGSALSLSDIWTA